MPEANQPQPRIDEAKTRLPRGLGYLAALVSGLVAVSALGGAAASILTTPPTWFLLGFEVVTLAATVFGVLIGLGRYSSAPGLGLACVAGTVGASALFGYLGAAKELMGVSLLPFVLARVVAVAVLVGISVLAVLGRRPAASLPKLTAGVTCGVGMILIGFAAWKGSGALGSLGVPAQAIIGFIGFAMMLGLLAAAVHLIVAAFEACGVDQLEGSGEPGRAS